MEKLCAWQGSGVIGPEAVRRVSVPSSPQGHIFALTDALAGRDKRGTLRELARQLAVGAEPHYLLSMYAFALRNVLSVKDLTARGMPPGTVASRMKLHPFVVSKSLGAARRFSVPELVAAHRWLARADRDTKRGARDPVDALYDFVLSVM
jgi:DNA polymerase-3 subunit delta